MVEIKVVYNSLIALEKRVAERECVEAIIPARKFRSQLGKPKNQEIAPKRPFWHGHVLVSIFQQEIIIFAAFCVVEKLRPRAFQRRKNQENLLRFALDHHHFLLSPM